MKGKLFILIIFFTDCPLSLDYNKQINQSNLLSLYRIRLGSRAQMFMFTQVFYLTLPSKYCILLQKKISEFSFNLKD